MLVRYCRLKRSAYWFLGEYCGQLSGSLPDPTTQNDTKSDTTSPGKLLPHGNSPRSRQSPGSNELLGNWSSSSATNNFSVGLEGIDAGAVAIPHPVVAAMNGATVSILLRLKHAAMFEDLQVTGYRGLREGGFVCVMAEGLRWVGKPVAACCIWPRIY